MSNDLLTEDQCDRLETLADMYLDNITDDIAMLLPTSVEQFRKAVEIRLAFMIFGYAISDVDGRARADIIETYMQMLVEAQDQAGGK